MSTEASRAIKLFGTEEAVNPLRILKAGELTAELDGGNLRHISYGGTEVIRAVSFIVRDRNWGTYNPDIEDLKIEETPDRFAITYTALARDDRQSVRYSARIEGTASGRLAFVADSRAETDFLTNRTGFVVLHPCEIAGRPVTIEHADGSIEQSRFPEQIDPVQPMLNLRELTHEAASGLTVTCRMEGDVYEMEDQRNWTDASYKTYVRPLALPWPYTLTKGDTIAQAVRLTLKGPAPRAASRASNITLAVGANLRAVPPLGLGLHPNDIATTNQSAETLRLVGARHVIGFYDPREGHDRGTLLAISETAAALGAQPWLEAVITSVEGFRDELAALGREVAGLGSPFPVVLVSPAPDLKCTLPGSPWPPAPSPRDFFTAARAAFPDVRLGGGMFSYFTELNRKRPPADLLDLVSFTTTATLHAGDDHSITEGLESVPAMAITAAKIAGGKPWVVGPSAIGMRMNPYGEAPLANPANIRQAMNFNDPRHRGLLGAAWMLGFFARFAAGGAAAIALGSPVGAFGLLHSRQAWPQPWFDENGGLYPAFHVLRGVAHLGGAPMRAITCSAPSRVQALAVERENGLEIWLANLTSGEVICDVDADIRSVAMLDEANFVAAASDPNAMTSILRPHSGKRIALAAYAVARVRI
jgi:D-apionolactonase